MTERYRRDGVMALAYQLKVQLTMGEDQEGEPGDWLVQESHGPWRIVRAATFEREYKRWEGEMAHAVPVESPASVLP